MLIDKCMFACPLSCILIPFTVDPCSPNPCENSGTCQQIGINGDYRCTCSPGYTGVDCQSMILYVFCC